METKQHATKKYSRSMKKPKRKLKITLREMTMKTQPVKIYGMPQKQFLEVHSNTGLSQKQTNKQENLKSTT